jgi:hypothetical protein
MADVNVGDMVTGEHPAGGQVAGKVTSVREDPPVVMIDPGEGSPEIMLDPATVAPLAVEPVRHGDTGWRPADTEDDEGDAYADGRPLTPSEVAEATAHYVQLKRVGVQETLAIYTGDPAAAATCASAVRQATGGDVRLVSMAPTEDQTGHVYRTPEGEAHIETGGGVRRRVTAFDAAGNVTLSVVTGYTDADREIHGDAYALALSLVDWSDGPEGKRP